MRRSALLALALAAAVGACSVEDRPADRGIPPGTTSREAGEVETRAVTDASQNVGSGEEPPYADGRAPVIAVPNPGGGRTVTGSLAPVNDSGVAGSVTLAEAGAGATIVSVSVTQGQPDAAYRVAVNRGRCGSTGQEVAAVGAGVRMGAARSGAVTDTLRLDAAAVMDGRHSVTVNGANAGPATPPLACADIPLNPRQQ